MPIIKYTGALGPDLIVCGGIPFRRDNPVAVDDALAEKLLAKRCFVTVEPEAEKDIPATDPDILPAATVRKKERT